MPWSAARDDSSVGYIYRGIRLGWLTPQEAGDRLKDIDDRRAFLQERFHAPLGGCWTPSQKIADDFALGFRPYPYERRWRRPYANVNYIVGLVMCLDEKSFTAAELIEARANGEAHAQRNRRDHGFGFGDENESHFEASVQPRPFISVTLLVDGPTSDHRFDVRDLVPPRDDWVQPQIPDHSSHPHPRRGERYDGRCRICRYQAGLPMFRAEFGHACPECGSVEIEIGACWPWGDPDPNYWFKPSWMERG